jgi:hypothetical protein
LLGQTSSRERDRRVLKRIKIVCPRVATLTTEFRTASGSNFSTITACGELYEMAEQPHSLEWWITLRQLAVRRTNLGLADARRTLPARTHNANCKVLTTFLFTITGKLTQ